MKCYITKCANEGEYTEVRMSKDEVHVCLVHLLEFLRGQNEITTRKFDQVIKQIKDN